ncbi:hypothetical protein BV20DRAFT_955070 [Pilatotrama ljubarskyi]|nr:hypothetical protein BV20DRAFT_955070 [Pilatotrama ljubarskyi]
MQTQDDPFQDGGSIVSSKLTVAMIITQLLTGYSCMTFLSTLSCDWALATGKIGCRPGAFLVYFGCRYMSFMSVISTIVYLDAFPVALIDPLRYLSQVTAGISIGLAYTIFLVRIAFMFKKTWLGTILDILKLVLWIIIWNATSQLPNILQNHLGSQVAEAIYTLIVSTFAFASSLVQVLYLCRQEHGFKIRPCAAVMRREDVVEFGTIWVTSTLAAVRTSKVKGGRGLTCCVQVVSFVNHDSSGEQYTAIPVVLTAHRCA